jgi:hypothetical protein
VLTTINRDGRGQRAAAENVGCSARKLSYLMPAARQH